MSTEVRVEVVDDCGGTRFSLAEFIADLQKTFSSIPPEHRGRAFFEINAGFTYDGDIDAGYKIAFIRADTPKEIAALGKRLKRLSVHERDLCEGGREKAEEGPWRAVRRAVRHR